MIEFFKTFEPWFAMWFASFSTDPDAVEIAVHSVGVDHGKEGMACLPRFLPEEMMKVYIRGWMVGHDYVINKHITEVV